MGPTCGDAVGSPLILHLSAARIAPARTSGADDAEGGSVGSLGGGVGLSGGGSDGDGCGGDGGSEGDIPPRVGCGSPGGLGPGPPRVGFAAGPTEALGFGDAPLPSASLPPGASEPSRPPSACRPPGATCPPSESTTVPFRSAVERGAGLPALVVAHAHTACRCCERQRSGDPHSQTAWGGQLAHEQHLRSKGNETGLTAQLPVPHKGHAPRYKADTPRAAPWATGSRANSAPKGTGPSLTSNDAPVFAAAGGVRPHSARRGISYENVEHQFTWRPFAPRPPA